MAASTPLCRVPLFLDSWRWGELEYRRIVVYRQRGEISSTTELTTRISKPPLARIVLQKKISGHRKPVNIG
jgi:hypothetical protein